MSGDKVSFVGLDGVVRTESVTGWSYMSPRPEIVRQLSRWQRMVRRLTPQRFRKSLVVRPAELAKVTLGFDEPDQSVLERHRRQLQNINETIERMQP